MIKTMIATNKKPHIVHSKKEKTLKMAHKRLNDSFECAQVLAINTLRFLCTLLLCKSDTVEVFLIANTLWL